MSHRRTVIVLAAIGIAAATAAACSTSSSSTAGTETFAGTEHLTAAEAASNSYVPLIPLTATGAFSDSGSISLTPGSGANGNGPGPATIKLVKGNLSIQHGASGSPSPVAAGGCVYTATSVVSYTITGGTGSYANATGSGTAKVTESFTLPKLASGACNTSNSAVPVAASVVFKATGPVTVPS